MLDGLLFAKTPSVLTALYGDCLWKVNTQEKILYLTFDDGPIPEVTPFVLNELKKWNAKATFFCVGKNVEANPKIFEQLINDGHTIGNHTYDHLNGWYCNNKDYFANYEKCSSVFTAHFTLTTDHYFRPPYGKLKPAQYRYLKKRSKIVMWDVLSFDFDNNIPPEKVLDNVLSNAGEGSIVVFHDAIKAKNNLQYALPKVLEHFYAKGFKFEKL